MAVSFKLQQASQEDGWLAMPLAYIHFLTVRMSVASATFYVNGSINNKQAEFLLDSSVAISVIHHMMVPNGTVIRGPTAATVGATGTP